MEKKRPQRLCPLGIRAPDFSADGYGSPSSRQPGLSHLSH